MKESDNIQSEKIHKLNKQFFFAIEHTGKTGEFDIDDMCLLLDAVCKRYNMRWCQAIWKNSEMYRLIKKEEEQPKDLC